MTGARLRWHRCGRPHLPTTQHTKPRPGPQVVGNSGADGPQPGAPPASGANPAARVPPALPTVPAKPNAPAPRPSLCTGPSAGSPCCSVGLSTRTALSSPRRTLPPPPPPPTGSGRGGGGIAGT
ncbi:hypothetical protein B8W66_00050 [Mycobacterium decipiens]|uniref:Uncharacterized protein n=1 Tax=Mycobacterium decipiens TaxID=1430326 RepID=A0A1X2LZZ2_9MYCO|nr:hypothetical protein B8W66_00050 [Mycobacterium decipiens]